MNINLQFDEIRVQNVRGVALTLNENKKTLKF